MIFDNSDRKIIAGPITIGDDDSATKYRVGSYGRTFWAYNGSEVFYSGERMYDALDRIVKLEAQNAPLTYNGTKDGNGFIDYAPIDFIEGQGGWCRLTPDIVIDVYVRLRALQAQIKNIKTVYETIDLNACVMAPRKLFRLTDAIYAHDKGGQEVEDTSNN